jgi:hypothetical protein
MSMIRIGRLALRGFKNSNFRGTSATRRGDYDILGRRMGIGESTLRYGLEEAVEDFAITKAFGFDDSKWEQIYEEIIRSKEDGDFNPGQQIIIRDEFIPNAIGFCSQRGKDYNAQDFVNYLQLVIADDKYNAISITIETTANELQEAFESIYGNYGLSFALGIVAGGGGAHRSIIGASRARMLGRFRDAEQYSSYLRYQSRSSFADTPNRGVFGSDARAYSNYFANAQRNYGINWNTNKAAVERSRQTATKYLKKAGYGAGLTPQARARIRQTRINTNVLGYRP